MSAKKRKPVKRPVPPTALPTLMEQALTRWLDRNPIRGMIEVGMLAEGSTAENPIKLPGWEEKEQALYQWGEDNRLPALIEIGAMLPGSVMGNYIVALDWKQKCRNYLRQPWK